MRRKTPPAPPNAPAYAQSGNNPEMNALGQFIPPHYHHNMLADRKRMEGFKSAIAQVVFEGARVLELGGGTGALSCFAAARASRVWCVEMNPEMIAESRRLLVGNPDGHKVEVVHADAFCYLPPEPVDVVICEMVHAALLREKQVAVIESFKARYLQRFSLPLPIFVPEAVILAVQPVWQNYDFFGFHAPVVRFQKPDNALEETIVLAAPAVYCTLDFSLPSSGEIRWEGQFTIEKDGTVNALRFLTKSVLAVLPAESTTVDWLSNHLVLPLDKPIEARAGDVLQVRLNYPAGGALSSLEGGVQVTKQL